MRKVTKYVVGVAVALGLAGGVVAANSDGEFCQSEERMTKHGDRMVKKVTKRLDLNDSQQVALKQLQSDVQNKMKDIHASKGDTKESFKSLFGSQFDQTGAIQLMQAKTNKVNLTAPEMVASFANFYDSLDAAQQAKVVEMMDKRGGRKFGLFGMGKGHHDKHNDQDVEQG
ncbi:MAG: protein CpxP [Neolewinella sp.]|jgi:protein CpxP